MNEKQLHKQVCDYIRLQYPKILFNTDLSGIKLTIGQATQIKSLRSCKGFPDIVIYEPCRGFHCLFIELKREGEKIFKKSGEAVNEHIQEQVDMNVRLMINSYYAAFAIGFDDAKKLIDWYLNE
jgi:hypothetical protein